MDGAIGHGPRQAPASLAALAGDFVMSYMKHLPTWVFTMMSEVLSNGGYPFPLYPYVGVTRSRGAPKRRFRDQLKATLLRCDIDHTNWESLAENRSEWRRTITQGTDHMEQLRRSEAERKRQQRKERLLLPRSPPTLPCTKCPRLFHTALGLSSHLRHRHQQSTNETGWT
uniref:C2H2-type domain-containing protein n=1 Tax=Branchiostoma floridae TaxID=7739 RepID=C3ZHB1_BRAFL|eukprot:XP_002592083.1 hypothetical protein BRAFLDRAFT_104748 [Branchiostoma floridae]